jgi:hypothetical protein
MIINWLSDYELEEQLVDLIKKREIDQKFLYFWQWADTYYKAYGMWNEQDDLNLDKYGLKSASVWAYHFLKTKILDKEVWKKWVIISLWCGNWHQEWAILRKINPDKRYLSYIWVDSSKWMLWLARKNLSDLDIEKTFICADFTSSKFVNEIHWITSQYDYVVYCFLWYTFWNPNQTSITDSLYNILWENDYLLLDALVREYDTPNVKLKLFDRYSSYLDNDLMKKFWFTPLKYLWIPMEKWKMILKTENEESIWSIVFKYTYEFTDRIKLEFRWKTVHILPWENIELLAIRNYDYSQLKSFFREHEFELINSKENAFEEYISSVWLLFKRK